MLTTQVSKTQVLNDVNPTPKKQPSKTPIKSILKKAKTPMLVNTPRASSYAGDKTPLGYRPERYEDEVDDCATPKQGSRMHSKK